MRVSDDSGEERKSEWEGMTGVMVVVVAMVMGEGGSNGMGRRGRWWW